MYKRKKYIIFCICRDSLDDDRLNAKVQAFKILGDKEEYNKTYYVWTLIRRIRKYTEEEKSTITGELVLPSESIDTELTAEFVIEQLGGKVDFDFAYTPEDGDQLSIGVNYKYVQIENHERVRLPIPMEFVFEKGEWHLGFINHLEYKQEIINKGKVMLSDAIPK